ncbi:MAG: hypothetical protein AAF362_02135 [Pseudomonadota bacterium]
MTVAGKFGSFLVRTNLKIEKHLRQNLIEIACSDLPELRFFQFRDHNAKIITRLAGKDDVKLADTPHFDLAVHLLQEQKNSGQDGADKYREYMDKDEAGKERKTASARTYFELFREGKIKPKRAVLTRLAPDGPLYFVDGNHRAAFSLALKRDLPAAILPLDQIFRSFWSKQEAEFDNQRGIPEFTISLDGNILVSGARDDLEKRLAMIPPDVIAHKNILDIGNSFGMNPIALVNAGSPSVKGIVRSKAKSNWSNRFILLSGNFSNASVVTSDEANSTGLAESTFDTVFLAPGSDRLGFYEEFVAKGNYRSLIIECQPNSGLQEYENILAGLKFRKRDQLGMLSTSATNKTPTRELWLLERDS